MKNIIILFFLLNSFHLLAQKDTSDLSGSDTSNILTVIETMPRFLAGGEKGMLKMISDSIKYPKSALKEKVGGKVFVQFTVDTTGNVTNVHIVKGVREDIDKEAVRVVSLLNGWEPGTQNKKKVTVVYNIPINFWPDKKTKEKYSKKIAKENAKGRYPPY